VIGGGVKNAILRIMGIIIRGPITHPGAQPKPFLRPALDENKSKIISKFESKMRSGIERETQKLARS